MQPIRQLTQDQRDSLTHGQLHVPFSRCSDSFALASTVAASAKK